MKVYFNGIFKFSVAGRNIMFEGNYETHDDLVIRKLKALGFKDLEEEKPESKRSRPKKKAKPAKKEESKNENKSE